MFLVYGGLEGMLDVKCYMDAWFETDREDTKSQLGYFFIMNGGAIAWRSLKKNTTTMSYTEVEYIVVSKAAQVDYRMK